MTFPQFPEILFMISMNIFRLEVIAIPREREREKFNRSNDYRLYLSNVDMLTQDEGDFLTNGLSDPI